MLSATVLSNSGSESELFTMETGVKQGCIIAPTLFAIFISAILHLIGQELPQGIPILYRTDGRLFNLNRFKAKSKVSTTIIIIELQYTDNIAITAHCRRPSVHPECLCQGIQGPGSSPEYKENTGPTSASTQPAIYLAHHKS
ncbi:hypothetical protein AAFF_G00324350 [Aldrovandia affinis]|uniref:Reverse transcriptase domain-containing protein n=1 Tax=Aldrovandia affinis TaxID=143900 RepID=A0AAD7W081_9TELE|nr:hypothetical protein AAFF_G00324350 [Aldrovandia affinis]